ncbi:MAG: DUF4242 domain-containing protein [Candidatus Sulfotelmatobacter sp.]
MTQEQVLAISQKSCGVLKNLGPQIQWFESYVTQDKIYCVYIAPDEAMVREMPKGGFPASRVSDGSSIRLRLKRDGRQGLADFRAVVRAESLPQTLKRGCVFSG